MQKICLIKQPKGIGDIVYCQKIGYMLKEMGYKIIWPVREPYSWVKDYLKDFEFPTVTEDFPFKEMYEKVIGINSFEDKETGTIVLPLVNAVPKEPLKIMMAKYDMINAGWENWAEYFNR